MTLIARLFSSIQTRLLAVFLINTLLTVAIVFGFNQWLRSQLITEADNALLVNAHQIADRIDEFNRSNQQAFNMGAKLPGLVDFLQADDETREELNSRTYEILDSLEFAPWDQHYVLSQAILDRDGLNVMDTALANIGTDESQQTYFQAVLSGGSFSISPVQFRPERGGVYFYYAMPLRESDPPLSIIGVLRIQLAISTIQEIVFNSTRGQDFEVVIFNENYVRLADSQHQALLFQSIADLSAEEIATLKSQYALPPLPNEDVSSPITSLANIFSNIHQDRVVDGYTSPLRDVEERLAIVKLETVPWYLVVSQPAGDFYEPVQRQSTGILVLALALTIMALVSSYLIARRITKPIRTLTQVARQVADGALSIKAPVTSSDEVGTLAETFNRMTTELQIAQATLEVRVKKRTQELSETNEKLRHEIAERKRYEQQALELALEHERRRILADFIRKASHEFRTPLSIINVKSYLIRRLLPREEHRHVTIIEEQGKYIEGLINRMVLMVRLDSGMAVTPERVGIDGFMKTLYANNLDSIKAKRASIHLDLQAADISICVNPELLSTAVQNILENALTHAGEPSEIVLKTWTQDNAVLIGIADKGTGIPAEVQAHVFELFFRADEAHTTRGFGLGLPIAKRIVENMGGTIELDSEVGRGTMVTLKFDVEAENC